MATWNEKFEPTHNYRSRDSWLGCDMVVQFTDDGWVGTVFRENGKKPVATTDFFFDVNQCMDECEQLSRDLYEQYGYKLKEFHFGKRDFIAGYMAGFVHSRRQHL